MTGNPTIIPITELRRRFGEITTDLAAKEPIILTKSGRPYAILRIAPEERLRLFKSVAGSWKGTELDNDDLWKEVLRRKSRKHPINL